MLRSMLPVVVAFYSLSALSAAPVTVPLDALFVNLSQNQSLLKKDSSSITIEKIRLQVILSYEASLKKRGDHVLAYEEISNAINKDILLLDPKLREKIRTISFDALNSARGGLVNSKQDLKELKTQMKNEELEKENFILENEEVIDEEVNDSEKRDFVSRKEFISFLASPRPSVRWLSRGGQDVSSTRLTKSEAKIVLSPRAEFLGIALDIGPSIKWTRNFSTVAIIMAEGQSPVLKADGNFDFYKYDLDGSIIKKNGIPIKRFMSVTCKEELSFENEIGGSVGVRFMGMGGDAAAYSIINQTVAITSRRVFVPELIDGKTVTIKYLTELCHNDFMKARVGGNLTVQEALEKLMENYVSNLRVSHEKTNCANDSHCKKWFRKELMGIHQAGNFPRCIADDSEGFMACRVRGLEGQNCAVIENGKTVSSGMFEYTCDKGLTCVKVKDAGWFNVAEGKCRPIDPKNYKKPSLKETYYQVELINR